MTTPLALPDSVLDLVEFAPIEDITLAILREGLPEIEVVSLIPQDPPNEFILTRRTTSIGEWNGDERFIDHARFFVHCFAVDPEGDEKAATLAEAVRVTLRNAWRNGWSHPDLGSVVRISMKREPHRETDWATSTGPVQYADLPTGTWRYSADYEITVRKPLR